MLPTTIVGDGIEIAQTFDDMSDAHASKYATALTVTPLLTANDPL